jgi:UDP-N-acetylglucosamine--N-acetylmuramyl-(pentapeptide) pyrophosphoryl-undecaprenol N-acetylglucosamine transferase
VVVAGGGTAGHVFPAIALAEALARDHGAEVALVGSAAGQEARLVPAAGLAFHGVAADQLPREISARAARATLTALRSVRACRPIVEDADIVVGMGGYASVPAVLAAVRARRPMVLHEQNAVPGLANRLASRWARAVALSFAGAARRLPRARRTVVTGNPVRASILDVPASRHALAKEAREAFGFDEDRRTLLVTGGSQGALRLDRAVTGALELMRDRDDLQVLVLSGPAHRDEVRAPARAALRLAVVPFLDRMELAYAVADLAISRAGATSIAELTACGVPSILVPYPHATARHQEANARELERAGGAEVVPDADLSPQRLRERVDSLLGDPHRLAALAAGASSFARPDAAERLAGVVVEAA